MVLHRVAIGVVFRPFSHPLALAYRIEVEKNNYSPPRLRPTLTRARRVYGGL